MDIGTGKSQQTQTSVEAKITAATQELQQQLSLVQNADTKASILLTAISAIFAIFFSVNGMTGYAKQLLIDCYSNHVFRFILFCISFSMMCAGIIMLLFVLMPRFVKKEESALEISLCSKGVFEGAKEYINGLKTASLETILDHQAEQAHIHALIARRKYLYYFWGTTSAILGIILFSILLLIG